MKKLNEVFSEETIYVVHSDTNENNILQDFDDLSAALEYAKDNIDELTYIEEVVKNSESDEIYSTEIIWSYDEDDAEDQVVCEWCHDLVYETECRRELNLGLICRNCQSALYSRGEKPVFEEAYDSDYAEGDDVFVQDFPESNSESKYSLEESSEPKWNIGSNKLIDRYSIEYQYLEELAARLQEERPYNKNGDYVFYEVARTYEDYGAGMEWYTIIVNDPKSVTGSYQLLYPNQWIRLANTGDVEGVLRTILNGSQLTELFDVDLNVGIDGGDNNDVSVLSSYKPKKGEDKLDELFDADINLSLDGGTGNNVNVLSPLSGLGEDLEEGLNNKENAELMRLCKEIGIKGFKDLSSFMKEVGLEVNCDPHNVLDALREYRTELGPDFRIIHEETDVELNELFGFGKKKQSNNRYVLAMFRDKSGRLFTSNLWRDICDIVDSYVKSHEKSRKNHFSAPTLFQIEFVATEQIANSLKREIDTLLEDLPYQRKYISGTRDHVNSAGEINADVAKSAKYLIKMECIEKNITESISEEVKLSEGEKVFIPDYDQHPEVDSYIIVSNDSTGKYFKQGWEAEVLRKLGTEEDYSMDCDWCYYSLVTNNLEESERYPTIEDAMSALERAANDYTSGTTSNERTGNNTFIVDWTGEISNKSAWYSYTVKALRFRRTAYLELEENLKEEVKLATNKKGDYLVAAESGKGYTVFSKDNVHLGGFDGEDDKAAIDRFNKGDFKESLNEGHSNELDVNRELGGYVIVDTKPSKLYGKYWGENWEKKALDKIDRDDGGLDEEFYIDIMTDDLDEAEVYGSVEDALSAIEETMSMPGTFLIKREGKNSIIIDWSGMDDPEYYFVYEVKRLYHYTHSWSELEEQLTEGYKTDLPQIRVREIKSELDLHGDITFDLPEPIDESDEDGWRGASEIIVVEKEAGEYEGCYQWLDQDGDLIESDADLYFEDFEELLYWLDDYLVNIVDLEEYIGSEIAEGLKEAKDSEEETELKTQDSNAGLDDQAADAEQVIEVGSEVLEESQTQEISGEYRRLSKEFGIDFNDLVYGEKGFMKTKYPEGFPDFAGDVIYSEKYWNELVEFAKEQNINLK